MKRFMNALLAFVLFVSMSTPMSFAESVSQEVLDIVNDANEKIEVCVEQAQKQAVGSDEEKVDQIIDKLVEKTNSIAEKAAEKVQKEGYTVVFEYHEVVVGGKTVEIDPMTVH